MKRYIVKQEDSADCGACALLSIIKFYKGYVPLEIIKIDTLTNEEGTNLYNLKIASEKYGFNAKGIKTNKLKNIKLPCIAQVNINGYFHFVTIYKINDIVTLMDSSYGIKKLSLNEFTELFTGYVLEIIPAGKIIKYEKNNLFEKVLINIYKEHIKTIMILFFLAFLIVTVSLVTGFNPVLLKETKMIPVVLILSIIKIIITYIKNNITSHLNKKININLLNNYLKQIFNLPLKYLQLKIPGDFINRINDLDNIKNIFSKIILDTLINSLLFIFSTIILFFINIKLTFVLMLITILNTIFLYELNKKIYNKIINEVEAKNILIDKIIEYLNKIITIKTNKIDYFKNRLVTLVDISNNKSLEVDKTLNNFTLITTAFEELIMIIIIIYYYHNGIYISSILLYLTIFGYYLESIKYFINLFPLIMYYKDVIKRIKSIYDIKNDMHLIKYSKDIHLNNITYSYNNINPIFTNLNIKIKHGSNVLIKGENGVGKSTLLDIIYGSITDYDGEVKASNNISYINQKSEIFTGTILDNIILNEKYNEKKLAKISKILLLDDLIKNKGYNFNITNITNLSGGEKQRIILARSLYRNFDILLIDEGLNQISKNNRKIILYNIFKSYNLKTIIYISHYDDQMKFDKIIKLTARKE